MPNVPNPISIETSDPGVDASIRTRRGSDHTVVLDVVSGDEASPDVRLELDGLKLLIVALVAMREELSK